jgi:hypothetical protein
MSTTNDPMKSTLLLEVSNHPEDFPPTKDVFPEERLPWVDLIHH